MTPYAVLAQKLVYRACAPYLPGDTPGKQIYRAWHRLDPESTSCGYSRVRNAFYGRASEKAWLWLHYRAVETGIEPPERTRTPEARHDEEYLERLRQERNNAHGATAEALDWALSRLGGHS